MKSSDKPGGCSWMGVPTMPKPPANSMLCERPVSGVYWVMAWIMRSVDWSQVVAPHCTE